MKKTKTFILFLIIFTLGGANFFYQDFLKKESNSNEIFVCDRDQNCSLINKKKLLNDCNEKKLENKELKEVCKFSKNSFQKTDMISDFENAIPAHFTKKNYEVNLLAKNFYGFDLEIFDENFYLLKKEGVLTIFNSSSNKTTHINLPFSKKEKQELINVIEFAENAGGIGNLGLALDKDFNNSGFFYVYSAYKIADHPSNKNLDMLPGRRRATAKLTKYQLVGKKIILIKTLIDNIPASVWHTGGRLEIGPDNKLYLTTGDAQEEKMVSNLDYLGGKILRINLDGTIPTDNPFKDSYVYSKGHRNPQGLAWNYDGQLFSSEHGNKNQDEINVIFPGSDYGWPVEECGNLKSNSFSLKDNFIKPVFCTTNWTMAPSGMDFITNKSHPWYNWLFIANLRGGQIHAIKFNDDFTVNKNEIFFVSQLNAKNDQLNLRMRDVEFFENKIYVLSDGGDLFEITPILN